MHVLDALWQRLGIGDILRARTGKHFGFDVERAPFAMVANRACAPAPKLYCHEQWLKEDVRIAGAAKLGLQHLYRAMDFLEANKEAIERAIFYHVADLLNLDVEVIFYDTTSLQFEIDEEDRGAPASGLVRGSQTAGGKAYPWRARCTNRRDCCSMLLTGTKRMLGRVTASQMAAVSAALFLLR